MKKEEVIKDIELMIKYNKTILPKLNNAEGRKPYHSVNCILPHYRIICDTCLGIYKYYIIIILCYCV